METITEKEVFTFDELSESAKETARDWMRELESGDFDTEFVYEDANSAAKVLGIEIDIDGIMWSGFSSQGDGACFTGRYYCAPNSSAKIRENYPTETDLHAIAGTLTALQVGHRLLTGHTLNAKVSQEGRGVHEMTMSVEVYDEETGEELWGEDGDDEIVKTILEAMRDFARWIYKNLEAEYDYPTSDEAIDETIRANDYEFDEHGEVI